MPTPEAELSGFTVTGGWYTSGGGGIRITSSSPVIAGNVISGNVGCSGVGIYSSFSSPTIVDNVIESNSSAPTGYSGCRGGGLYIGGSSAAYVVGNTIRDNHVDAGGGGLELFASGQPTIARNVIEANSARDGGAIESLNAQVGRIEQNLIRSNTATSRGGGVYWAIPSSSGPSFTNNTVIDNSAPNGPAMWLDGWQDGVAFTNNVVAASAAGAVGCGDVYGNGTPAFGSNTFWSGGADPVVGTCTDPIGADGNQSADPQLDGSATPTAASPAVDSGAPVSLADGIDLLGAARIVDGNGDGTATIDRGAIERPEAVAQVPSEPQDLTASFAKRNRVRVRWSPPVDDGGSPITGYRLTVAETGLDQTYGANTTSVTLTNMAKDGTYTISVRALNDIGASAAATTVLTKDDGGGGGGGGGKCHPKKGC